MENAEPTYEIIADETECLQFTPQERRKIAMREYQREYQRKNKEHLNAYMRQYRAEHPEMHKKALAKYREKNRDTLKELAKVYNERARQAPDYHKEVRRRSYIQYHGHEPTEEWLNTTHKRGRPPKNIK